ncbi:MAG: NAD(P)-dependent glycerol-3-phosphate dehydrogenase [Clostridia bacterium]|nr:NAD(P)-dependent glycerol-3-phosphate dehydrogenase [Clostridia bacterium]
MSKIAVLGAGAWGTTLAKHLCEQGKYVELWSYSQKTAGDINHHHRIEKLKEITLPADLKAYTDPEHALKDADIVISAIVSTGLREFLKKTRRFWPTKAKVLSTTKGLEANSGKRMSEVILEELDIDQSQIAILSGPNLAMDVAKCLPVISNIASYDQSTALFFQELLLSKNFRPYTNDDVVGVELNGAIKNVIAIAAGICYGMGLGQSIRAGIVARAMQEIWRVSEKMGADLKTSLGISGIGDIILTCTATASRNHIFGERIGKGESVRDVMADISIIAEGKNTVVAMYNLSQAYDLKMPICKVVYDIITEKISLKQAFHYLLVRPETPEFNEEFPFAGVR